MSWFRYPTHNICTYLGRGDPAGHVVVVRLPRVVVEEHDGGDHARGHHEHDAVEVSPWRGTKGQIKVEDAYHLLQGAAEDPVLDMELT